jgi:AcrR family transcriptional regulator
MTDRGELKTQKAPHPASTRRSQAAPGRRQSNKLDKLNRIKAAARQLFVSRGFDDTTVREIATRAGVGLGTLFSYSLNKRDLLFLLGNDSLDEVAEKAGAGLDPKARLADNLRGIFGAHYAFFASEPVLARLVLREMTFYDSGAQAQRFRVIRLRVIDHVAGALALAIASGEIAGREDIAFDAWVLFAIYQVELRAWLAACAPDCAPDLAMGLQRLERALKVCIGGLR